MHMTVAEILALPVVLAGDPQVVGAALWIDRFAGSMFPTLPTSRVCYKEASWY